MPVVFKDPPEKGTHRSISWVNELLARPGEWALVETVESASSAGGRASTLRRRMRDLGHPIEIRSSKRDIYARCTVGT